MNRGAGGGGGQQKHGGGGQGHAGHSRATIESDEIREDTKPAYLSDDSPEHMTHCISLAVIRSGSVGLQYQSGRGIHLPTVRIKPITNNQWKRHKESLKASMSSLLEKKFSMILNHIGEWTEEWDPTFCLRILSAQLSNTEGVHKSSLSLQWMTWPQILNLYEHFTWGRQRQSRWVYKR
jgi:hypothetical protein